MQSLPIVPAILGPTASGKSHLGIFLAKKLGGEIINCDSLQMYRRFDIGTGKLPESERQGIPHHLIDVLDPTKPFAAGEYARWARRSIEEIESRGKLPIIVGGTGFYFRALVDGLFSGPPRNEELRTRLQASAKAHSSGHLWRILHRLDQASALRIHPNDAPKLIRAIEVSLLARRPMSEEFLKGRNGLENHRVLKFVLSPPREALYNAINLRTQQMFDEGLIDEVKTILASGIPESAPPFLSLGYKESRAYLRGEFNLAEAISITQAKTRQYAKRQVTWFNKDNDVQWISGFGTDSEVQSQILKTICELTKRL
jgi:tRNA dimethylallyltransferase